MQGATLAPLRLQIREGRRETAALAPQPVGRQASAASARRNERQRQQMRGDAEAQIDGTAIAHLGLAALKIDLDVVVLEESPVERVHRFIGGLLRDEEQ